MGRVLYDVVVLVLVYATPIKSDYTCVCNYNVETAVYSQANAHSPVAGYMYEFDCKPSLNADTNTNFHKIAYEHQVGYLRTDSGIEVQTCPGDPPSADLCKSTHTRHCNLGQSSETHALSTTPKTTTTTPTTTVATTHSSTTPRTTATTTTTPPPTTTTTTTTSTTTTPTTTSSTTTTPTTTTVRNITLHPTSSHIVTGDISRCSADLHRYTKEDQGALTQYGEYCYELVPIRGIWERAERDCIYKGGYLIHIDTPELQNFIYKWINSYNFNHAVWIGLHDLWVEERFEWISRDPVVWTNWYHDRYGNLASHHNEDCVLLVPYAPYYGKWDDVICGQETIYGTFTGQMNPFICEFKIQHRHSSPIIG